MVLIIKYSLNNLKSQEICFGLNFLFLLFENNPNKTLRVMFHQDNFQLTIQCYPMDQHFFSINCQKFLFWLFSFLILHMENITLQQIPGALDHFNLLFHYEGLNIWSSGGQYYSLKTSVFHPEVGFDYNFNINYQINKELFLHTKRSVIFKTNCVISSLSF